MTNPQHITFSTQKKIYNELLIFLKTQTANNDLGLLKLFISGPKRQLQLIAFNESPVCSEFPVHCQAVTHIHLYCNPFLFPVDDYGDNRDQGGIKRDKLTPTSSR